MVIAELDADKYRDLAQEYDVHGFPTLKIFVNGEPKPYSGDRSLDDLVEFVNNAAGTARKTDGSVDTAYGRIPEVDEVIAQLKDLSEESLKKVREALDKVPEEMAANKKVYEQLMKKISQKGEAYIETEKARISKFLMSDSVSKLKKGAFRVRKNILGAFAALKEAAKILIQHFMMFSDEKITLETPQEDTPEEFDEEVLHMRQLLKSKLVDLDLSVRALNCLKSAEVETLGELVVFNKNDLLKFRNFGKKSLSELDDLLEKYNLSFGMDISKYKLDKD